MANSIQRLRFSAGHIKCAADLETEFGRNLLRSPMTAFTVGSVTFEGRAGNPEPHYGYDPETGTSYNAVGLKNPGFEQFYTAEFQRISDLAIEARKELIISLAPIHPGEVGRMAKLLAAMPERTHISRGQLNGGCPNVAGHSVIAHDPDAIEMLLKEVKPYTSLIDFEFKTSPEVEDYVIKRTVELCAEYRIRWIVSGNTEKVATPTDKYGRPYTGSPTCGRAGKPLLEPNLVQLDKFSEVITALGANIKLVAGGGISTAEDLRRCADAGATEAEMMTAVLENGPRVFQDILV